MYLNNSLLLIVFKSFILRKLLQVWLAQRPGRLRSPDMVHDPCSQLHIANPHHLTLSQSIRTHHGPFLRVMLSRCIPKSLRGVKPTLKFSSRLYHNAVAKFTNIDKKGMPVSYDTGIMIGEPGESYICIEPDIGKAFRRAVVSQLGSDGAHQVVTLPLRFDHRSLHFIHRKCPSEEQSTNSPVNEKVE